MPRRAAVVGLVSLVLVAPACSDDEYVVGAPGLAAPDDGGPDGGGASGATGDPRRVTPSELSLQFEANNLDLGYGTTDFRFLPDADDIELLVTSSSGKLTHFRRKGDTFKQLQSSELPEAVVDSKSCGLTNLVLDPNFSDNGFVYLSYCTTKTKTRLVRYHWSPTTGLTDPALIFQTELEEATDEWHRFGSMDFEEDGEVLWMMVGDHFLKANGQDTTSPMGSLVRIIPNRDADGDGYELPSGNLRNTLIELGVDELGSQATEDIHPTIYAYGFRSPWRATRDPHRRTIVGDVGLATVEEINLVTRVVENFGWSKFEGPCEADCEGFVSPLLDYTRAPDHPYLVDDPDPEPNPRRSVWVGEYSLATTPDPYFGAMNDVILFGDFYVGWVRALQIDEDGEVVLDRFVGHLPQVSSFRRGPDGYGYALAINGKLYRASLDDDLVRE